MLEDLLDFMGFTDTSDNDPAQNDTVLDMESILPGDNEDATPVDIDGDGTIDGYMYQHMEDLNDDGIADVVVSEMHLDLDHDGIEDTVYTDVTADTDLDGEVDYHMAITASDVNNDGQLDYISMKEDKDGDGVFDSISEFGDFDNDGIWDQIPSYSQEVFGDSGDASAYMTFDPLAANPESIVGNPAEAMESWHCQETGSSCAVASQEFVLEQLTGREFHESDLRELAESHGWYDPNGGTPMDDMGNILEYMGLDVRQSHGNTIDDIRECLENGGQVIVGVDSSELWSGQNNELFGPGMDADHAVQVIGLDYNDPSQPMVILNDPGTANGGGAMVPVEDFMFTWEDSGCFMVEAYA